MSKDIIHKWPEYSEPRIASPDIDFIAGDSELTIPLLKPNEKLRIAVLFDGAGLARLGLEEAGHECVGYELNPIAHYLSCFVGKGNTVLKDVKDITDQEFLGFDAVWASPPCQFRSSARTQGEPLGEYATDFLEFSLNLKKRFPHLKVVWVENVTVQGKGGNKWGNTWNAAQFCEKLESGIDNGKGQNRNRVISGKYPVPCVRRPYMKAFPSICPCVTASEYKGCASDKRRASRYYGRRLTVQECAKRMDFVIPDGWNTIPDWFVGTRSTWNQELYRAIGNGVPVSMARAFGEAVYEKNF